jgi:hypothetical protein
MQISRSTRATLHEGVVFGIELPLDPTGPHPVQVVLDDAAVEQTAA